MRATFVHCCSSFPLSEQAFAAIAWTLSPVKMLTDGAALRLGLLSFRPQLPANQIAGFQSTVFSISIHMLNRVTWPLTGSMALL